MEWWTVGRPPAETQVLGRLPSEDAYAGAEVDHTLTMDFPFSVENRLLMALFF